MAGASPVDVVGNAAARAAVDGGGEVVEETLAVAAEGSAAAAIADGRQADGDREGFPAIFLKEVDGDEEEDDKWVGQYSSTHSILLVGEGDFSFSLALATGFGSGGNLVATSLDSYDTLKKRYKQAESNLAQLKKMGAVILHGVDAKTMRLHTDLRMRRFDRVVFNFPHAGFSGKEDDRRVIWAHQELMTAFFRSASLLLRPYGEVHVSHKTKYPYNMWDLPGLAAEYALDLAEQADFHIDVYPGYNNKRGDGGSCDQPFMLGKCSTFKFRKGYRKMRGSVHRFSSMPLPSIGNCGVHPNSSGASVGSGPLNPLSVAPQRQWQQPCVPFDMFGMLPGSGFSHYDYATQRVGNSNVHQSSSLASGGYRPCPPPSVAPEWPQAYASFDMFGKPRGSGSSKYDYAAQTCLPGCVPQQNANMAGINHQDQRFYPRTPVQEGFIQEEARLRMLIALHGRE
ncbi:unnamed protein product [Alopecurus aequalis]